MDKQKPLFDPTQVTAILKSATPKAYLKIIDSGSIEVLGGSSLKRVSRDPLEVRAGVESAVLVIAPFFGAVLGNKTKILPILKVRAALKLREHLRLELRERVVADPVLRVLVHSLNTITGAKLSDRFWSTLKSFEEDDAVLDEDRNSLLEFRKVNTSSDFNTLIFSYVVGKLLSSTLLALTGDDFKTPLTVAQMELLATIRSTLEGKKLKIDASKVETEDDMAASLFITLEAFLIANPDNSYISPTENLPLNLVQILLTSTDKKVEKPKTKGLW